ncbi:MULTISPECIES: selenocysteine-specific translation elongation factor [unclassified Sedimentibacter]|uniref:selenocysteine-specific translation elongation factor n=1 Tax=unclassified Sedimentibacter TaxID=2649220 RepID=UPI0027E155E2|nr:selenocysteine-specific translation elongation factor [Sedimentibacter sp. MB35-C1]WMJ75864.1 selenocysteine-specific translation elongation factor [Sedimentibacter sp. MB35-C1]
MKNIIIGTAGHIDHGKTTLIKALTGRDTDRWEEEKRRGITIDLGFTYFDLPNGNKAGIIDVPGHEKFIKNMLAGVIGMDLVLLVVAADEGMMPQTVEHLNILNMLGVKKGIVVLTKYDIIDPEWLELVKDDVREGLKDTFLESAPIAEVSSKTGYGIDNLANIIVQQTEIEVEDRNINTIPRLPIDRVFSINGFGTVITGTLISGQLKKGDEIEIYPVNKISKIRNMQVHSQDADIAYAGQRTAVNLLGVKKTDLHRGCVIAPVNSMKDTKMLDVKLNLLKNSRRIVENRSRLHLYTGTSEVLCRVVLLDRDELSPGESCYAQLRLEEELAVRRGDKFIVRFYSPMETIGGGEIIEPMPLKKKRFDENLLEELKIKEKGSNADVIEKIIRENSKDIPTLTEVAKITALSEEEVTKNVEALEEEEKITVFRLKNDRYIWHKSFERKIEEDIDKYLFKYHENNKYSKGAKKAEIKSKFLPKMKQNVFDVVVNSFEKKGTIKLEGEFVSLPYFQIQYDEFYRACENNVTNTLNKAMFDFVKLDDLIQAINSDKAEEIISLMIDEKKIVKINEAGITTVEIFYKAKELLVEYIKKNSKITAAEYRDVLNTNRKIAIALLEYFDMSRVTKRVGNDRILS